MVAWLNDMPPAIQLEGTTSLESSLKLTWTSLHRNCQVDPVPIALQINKGNIGQRAALKNCMRVLW